MSKQQPSFDELMGELDALVLKLEGEDLTLDAAIENSEKALDLINACRSRLETAKQRIEKLTEKADGSTTVEGIED
jgi:exodeoxyribonuclease VII small subunit